MSAAKPAAEAATEPNAEAAAKRDANRVAASPADALLAAAGQAMPRLGPARWRARMKVEPADFVVEELPAYEPSGQGDHLFLWLEKVNVPALSVAPRLARSLGVPVHDIGLAGMKDTRAITRQYVSVPGTAEPALASGALDAEPDLRVVRAARHTNKLKTGHLRGNRFVLRLRDVQPPAGQPAKASPPGASTPCALDGEGVPAELLALLEHVRSLGLVNAFGAQRFGRNMSTLRLGLALLGVAGAGPAKRLSRHALRLALSAVQSALFNLFLLDRLRAGTLHRLQLGDVALVRRSQGPFVVDEESTANERYAARDIVLSGPMFGPKMLAASGAPGRDEQALQARYGLGPAQWAKFGKLTAGTRRPAVVWPEDLNARRIGPADIELTFALPSGSYATEVVHALFDWGSNPQSHPE